MNPWLAAAAVLLVVGMVPAVLRAAYGRAVDRAAGLSLAATVSTLVMLLLAAGYGRTSYLDVALVLAALSLTGSLVFAKLLVRP